MAATGKTRRHYDTSGRQRRAAENRRAMLDAAERSFLTSGYAATTIPAIARSAGVAPQTVYAAFGNKRGLLQQLFDVRVAGDDASSTLLERDWYSSMLAEPDAATMLRFHARSVRAILDRSAKLTLVLRQASAAEPELADDYRVLARERRYETQRAVTDELTKRGALRRDLTEDTAADILWTLSSHETYESLVLDRGWTPDNYQEWLATTLVAALLP